MRRGGGNSSPRCAFGRFLPCPSPMTPLRLLTLTVAALLVVAGTLVAFGLVRPPTPEPPLRVVVGTILVLMGLYRGAIGLGRRDGNP